MSRGRVITGVDERGRPKSTWADPEPDTRRGYGFMEPAYDATSVQRRQATAEELAAARERETEPSHLTTDNSRTVPVGLRSPAQRPVGPTDAERLQASRQRGAERHVELVAVRRAPAARRPSSPPEEEPAVSEAPANIPKIIPGEADAVLGRLATARGDGPWLDLGVLADAVLEAIEAQAGQIAAEIRWREARAALDVAYRGLEESPAVVPTSQPAPSEPTPIDRSTSRAGEGQRPGQLAARERRAATVMAAMERHGGDQKAAAAELGMKTNALAMVVKHARARTGATA